MNVQARSSCTMDESSCQTDGMCKVGADEAVSVRETSSLQQSQGQVLKSRARIPSPSTHAEDPFSMPDEQIDLLPTSKPVELFWDPGNQRVEELEVLSAAQ